MQKLLIYAVFLFCSFSAKGQTRSLSANFNNSVYYNAGVVQDFELNLNLQSQDNEYCDSISIVFPVGSQIISAPTQFTFEQTESQQPELLNASIGTNILSYGNNDNTRGGIQTGSHSFQIRIQFPSNLTGLQKIHWYLSGDETGSSPHEFSDSTTVSPLPNQPDLGITAGLQHPYSLLPQEHFDSVKLAFEIDNRGAFYNASNQVLINHIQAGGLNSETFNFNLNFEESTQFYISDHYDVQLGEQTFSMQLFENSDFNPANNRDTLQIEITDTVYAIAFQDQLESLPTFFNIDGIGQLMSFPTVDTLTSLTVQLLSPQQGDSIGIQIYSWTNGAIDQLLMTSDFKRIPTNFPSFYNFNVPNLEFTANDTFFVVLDLSKSISSSPAMGQASFLQPSDQFLVNGNWVPTDNLLYNKHINILYNVGEVEPYCASTFNYSYQDALTILFTPDNEGFNYNWSVNGSMEGTGPEFLYEFAQEGSYEICLESVDGNCEHTYCETLDVQINSTNSIRQKIDLEVFPNPANNVINICCSDFSNLEYRLKSMSGKLISKGRLENGQTSVELKNTSTGIYLMDIYQESQIISHKKIVINR